MINYNKLTKFSAPKPSKLDHSNDNPYVLEPLGQSSSPTKRAGPPSPSAAKGAYGAFERSESEPYLLLPPEHDEAQFLEKHGAFRTPPDLDKFLRKVYSYYEGKGFWPIILSRVTNLIIYAFVLLFSTFLIVFIDYHILFNLKPNYDITRAVRWSRAKNFYIFWGFAAFFYGFFFYLVALLVATVWENLELRRFYERQLDIPEAEIPTIDWADVVKKIVKVPRLCVTKENLTQLDVALILMSRENYIIALFNKELLDIHIPGTSVKMYTKVLEWSLQFSLFNWMFEQLQSKERMTESVRLTNTLRTRFVVFGLFFLIISPFVSVYLILYYFFQYGESLRNRPGSVLGMRGWSRYAQWKFREFNELSHDFRHRLNKSIEPANFYVGQFQSVVLSILAKLVMFTAGGVLAVLLIWGVISEDLLVHGELGDRTLLFYVGVLSVVVGIARGLVPDDNFVFQPQLYLDQVAAHVHYHPKVWKNARSVKAQKHFDELYEFNIVAFLKELLGVLVSPFVLVCVLPSNADRVISFFQEFTVYVAGIGPCCSYAYFPEMHSFGNAKHGAPRDAPKHKRTLHGKLEKSLVTFQSHYPDWQPTGDAERFFANLSTIHVPTDDPLLSSMHVIRTPLSESAQQTPLSASVQMCGSKDQEVLHKMQQSYAEQFGSRKNRSAQNPMMTASGVTASLTIPTSPGNSAMDRSMDPPASMQFVNSDA